MVDFKKILIACTEPVNTQFHRTVAAEFFATFFVIFFSLGTINSTLHYAHGSYKFAVDSAILSICFAFGALYASVTHIFGHVSGAHCNPAVTVAFAIGRLVSPLRAFAYICAQMVGGTIATFLVMCIMKLDRGHLAGWNVPSGKHGDLWRPITTELVMTMLLVLTMFATLDPNKTGYRYDPIALGVVVTIIHIVGLPITGCGTNPVRTFGPWFFSSDPHAAYHTWIFFITPFVGAILAAFLYLYWFADRRYTADEIRPLAREIVEESVPEGDEEEGIEEE